VNADSSAALDALLERTCRESGVPRRLEDEVVVEEVAAILRRAETTNAAPCWGEGGAVVHTTDTADCTRSDRPAEA
jgi:hypothetical protein